MREEIWTEKIDEDDAGYYLKIPKTALTKNKLDKGGIVIFTKRQIYCFSRFYFLPSLFSHLII